MNLNDDDNYMAADDEP